MTRRRNGWRGEAGRLIRHLPGTKRVSAWRERLADFAAQEAGTVAVISGLGMTVLVGFGGLAIEVNHWYFEKRRLQEAVDSAAMAAAYEYRNDASVSQSAMDDAAAAAVTKSGYATPTSIVVNNPPLNGPFATGGALEDPTAVEVVLTQTYSSVFAQLFGLESVDVATRAVAVQGGEITSACILSLACLPVDPGIEIAGSLDLTLVDCSVHSNDSCGDGIDFNGNPTVSGECITTGGLVSGDSNNLALAEGCDEPLAQQPDVDDPYEDVVVPDVSAEPCQDLDGVITMLDLPGRPWWRNLLFSTAYAAKPSPVSKTFSPGRYCGDMNFGDDNTLEPGVYFVEGDFYENGGSIAGDGVILVYMNADSTFSFNGNGDLAVTAPTADQIKNNNDTWSTDNNGDGIADNAFELISDAQADYWAGLVIFNTATDGLGDTMSCANKINGTSAISAEGAFYFPNTCLVFNGNNQTAGNEKCLQVIGGNLSLSGNSAIDSAGCDPSYAFAPYATMIGLVE